MLKTLEDTEPHKTLGVLHNELRNKETDSCSHLDLGYAFSNDIYDGVIQCIDAHWYTFGDHVKKFCVYCVLCPGEGDLKYVIRRKFFAWPHLPYPMPNQSVWLVDKEQESVMFLWSLPTPQTMAEMSESYGVSKEEVRMRTWCIEFFKGCNFFWQCIRDMHGIDFLSEPEFNDRNRKMGGKFVDDNLLGNGTNAGHLPEIWIKKLETVCNVTRQKLDNNLMGKAN